MATELELLIAKVMMLWQRGKNTMDIAWELDLKEADIWPLLRLGREQRRAKDGQP